MYTKASTESSEDLIPVYNDVHCAQMTINEESGRSYVVLAEPRKRSKFSYEKCKKSYIITTTVISIILLLLVIWLGVFNEYHYQCGQRTTPSKTCTSAGCVKAAFKLMSSYDKDANPCKDFFQYSCGGWLRKNRIPDNKTSWSVDTVLLEDNFDVLRKLLETESPVNSHKSKAEHEARRFYRSCLNDEKRNRLGASPLINLMKKLGLYPVKYSKVTKTSLTEKILLLHRNLSLSLLFHLSVGADDTNSSVHALKLNQAGIILPKKKYEANNSNEVLKAYVKLMTKIVTLSTGRDEKSVKSEMAEVLEFEKNISKIFVPMEKMTEIDEVYRKMTVKELQKLSPSVDWINLIKKLFGKLATITENEKIVVYTSDYFSKLAAVLKLVSPRTFANYVFWRIAYGYSPYLSDDFIEARKAFLKVLLGSSGSQPRWKECVSETDSVIGMAVGSLFVRETFSKSSKEQVSQMVVDIRRAFIGHLTQLEWMDEGTKDLAKVKANAMKEKIGFPVEILDPSKLDKMYKGLQFSRENFFENQLRKNEFELLKMLHRLRKSVDRKEWLMTPSTINAYYNPSFNEIVFPAGILQAPFYSKDYPRAVNYGGIGAIIGHELLHGFDNDGRLYDKNGNYGKTWWSDKSSASFKKMSKCFIDEYSKFALYGKNLNGIVTLGENIADNGGLKAAYIAYKKWVGKHGDDPVLPGLSLSNEQVFFVAYGQSWCSHQRKGKALYLLETDTHSPAKDRVLGTVSNLPEFAKAFNCPRGSPMNPIQKCIIW